MIQYWESIGLKVRILSYETDFNPNSKEFIFSKDINSLYQPNGENIIIAEYPNLREANIPTELIQQANLNLVIARADHGWKSNDKVLVNSLRRQVGETPLYLYLNQASRDEVQSYTGMLPPYTFFRRMIYRFSQLALTEKMSNLAVNSSSARNMEDKEDDEE